MNYCSAAFGIIGLISVVTWVFDGRKNFTGPKMGIVHAVEENGVLGGGDAHGVHTDKLSSVGGSEDSPVKEKDAADVNKMA
jgi:hypothetical protein